MPKNRIFILGAGLAGLSAAWHLKDSPVDFHVFEKDEDAGGLCRSKNISGFTFDLDGHLLHFRYDWTRKFVEGALGLKLKKHQRSSFIKHSNRYIPYPFQANFFKLPQDIARSCLNGLIEAENNPVNKYSDFKNWLYSSFGNGIARHFMEPYNEKFWTVPLSNITCEWLDGFIPVLKSEDIIKNKKNGFKSIGYNAHFYYPESGGIQELASALQKGITGKISTNHKATKIDLKNKRITFNDKEPVSYDKLLSTVPLPELKNIIKNLPPKITFLIDLLNYNSILVFNIGLKSKPHSDKHWIYFHQKKNKYFRVGFYSSFSKGLTPNGSGSMYAEISYPKGSVLNIDVLKDEIIKDLVREKIINSASDVACFDVVDIKYGYPIYDSNRQKAVSGILKFLSDNNIYSIGRYGSWRYMTMEDALLDGKNAVSLLRE